MSGDTIWLIGVDCRCRIGVPPAERRRPQKITIDLGLEVDAARAAASDDYQQAADYAAVEKAVRAEAQDRPRALIETLAEHAARAALGAAPAAAAVTVRVRKTPAAMPKTREVYVEIRRTRAERR